MQQKSLSSALLATISRLYLCLSPGRLILSERKLQAAVMILLVGISLPTFAQKSTSKVVANPKPPTKPSAAAPATGGSKSTFTITVDQNYCDVSLPYTYSSTKKDLKLNVQSTGNWSNILQSGWNQYPQIAATAGSAATLAAQENEKIDLSFTQYPPATPMTSGGADDTPVLDGGTPPRAEINDEGDALLGDPTNELHTNTFDVQRLLVRTLFGPNPFQSACAYPYLKYPDYTISKKEIVLPDGSPSDGYITDESGNIVYVPKSALGKDAFGAPFQLFGKGSGYAFSLNNSKSPQYFLIDVVRWKDAPVPTGGPTSIPYFQPASDDWYLFNYSDWKERPQDISKWFRRVTPALANETLRIVGSKQVMFLAIHLAPMMVLSTDPTLPEPSTVKGKPTEQAWYDDVNIKYSIQASSYEPTQMKDLDSLVQILGSYIGLNGSATPQANPAAPAAVPAPAPFVVKALPPPLHPSKTIDNFLRQSTTPADPIMLSTYQGRYAAGILTNLTALPVNLTNTWTATFSTSNKIISGAATAYDTRTPAELQSAAAKVDPSTPPASSAPPCSVAIDSTNKTKQADCNVTGAKVQNEGLAHWDVSVVVPASSYSDVTFQASTTTGGTNSITAKTVSRTNAYAVLDLFLYPEDLVRPPNIGLPHLIVGLPLAGKVFDKPYFAVGETLNLPNTLGKLKIFNWIPGVSSQVSSDLPLSIRPTFGWVYNKVFPTPGSSASYRSLKPQFGVEISISSLVKTLSKSSGSTPKTTTPSTVPSTN